MDIGGVPTKHLRVVRSLQQKIKIKIETRDVSVKVDTCRQIKVERLQCLHTTVFH